VVTETSVVDMWRAILDMFVRQSREHIIHLRSKLSSMRKGESCVTYYALMKGFTDEMAVIGKCPDDEEVICYIL
jgi:hypothetical protein